MDFVRREMEEAGWTFPEDGTAVPPTGERSEALHVAYKGKREKRQPMSPEVIRAIVGSIPRSQRTGDAVTVIGADPSINDTGLAWIYRGADESTEGWLSGTRLVRTPDGDSMTVRLRHLASQVDDFCAHLLSPSVGVVEGHYWSRAENVSPLSIQTYCEAVGTCYGVLSTVSDPRRVDPDWMPRILCGRVKGGTAKEDRHAIAEALLKRTGSTVWSSDASEHEKDALCLCVAYLVEEGWL